MEILLLPKTRRWPVWVCSAPSFFGAMSMFSPLDCRLRAADDALLQFSRTKKYTDSLVFGRISDQQQFPFAPYFCQWLAAVFDHMPIRQYLDGERFDPETTRLLGIAFETAIQALHWAVDDPPREAIAGAIIGFAKAGERDPERLCDLALATCSKPIISDPSPLPPHASLRRNRILEFATRASGPIVSAIPAA